MREKVFIFGSGFTGFNVLSAIEASYDVIGFLDNDPKRWTDNMRVGEVGGVGGGISRVFA
jgi:FlaA1/EpsC-like NDP-sugar epimerase